MVNSLVCGVALVYDLVSDLTHGIFFHFSPIFFIILMKYILIIFLKKYGEF